MGYYYRTGQHLTPASTSVTHVPPYDGTHFSSGGHRRGRDVGGVSQGIGLLVKLCRASGFVRIAWPLMLQSDQHPKSLCYERYAA